MVKWIAAEKVGAELRHAVVCPNVTERAKERIAQSNRTRAGSLAIVDYPQGARTCIPRAEVVLYFSGVTFVLFLGSFSSFLLLLKPRPFVQSFLDMRPVHRGQSAHTQRMVQLPEVHPQTVRPTERSPNAPDAQSRGTRDNAVRLRHAEPARAPLRHAALSPPQLPDSLHRLAKEQSRRPPGFLYEHAHQDGK